jgi:hypothetical protein
MSTTRREPRWSGALTRPLGAHVPAGRRRLVIDAVKTFHSIAFFSIFGLILVFTWDGIRGRSTRRTATAAAIALAETAVFVTNNQVCPLTPLVEELGAESGSVTDIFLPDPISRRIPAFSGAILVLGLVLQGRLWRVRTRGCPP